MTRDERRVTELEMAVLVTLGHAGTVKAAARQLRISERTAQRRLERLCRRFDVETPIQVAFLLLKQGVQNAPLLRSTLSSDTTSDEVSGRA